MRLEQFARQQQQVAEINRVEFAQALLVDAIDFGNRGAVGTGVGGGQIGRHEAFVFGLVDTHPEQAQVGCAGQVGGLDRAA